MDDEGESYLGSLSLREEEGEGRSRIIKQQEVEEKNEPPSRLTLSYSYNSKLINSSERAQMG